VDYAGQHRSIFGLFKFHELSLLKLQLKDINVLLKKRGVNQLVSPSFLYLISKWTKLIYYTYYWNLLQKYLIFNSLYQIVFIPFHKVDLKSCSNPVGFENLPGLISCVMEGT